MSKSIQLKTKDNEKMYPNPYYPVGSIYLSVIDVNPTTWFGGTWEKIAKGRTLVGVDTNDTDFNTVQKTGGEKTHKLVVNEIPAHNHRLGLAQGGNTAGWGLDYTANSPYYRYYSGTDFNENTGGGQAHNNVQPYFTCYIWCRTA